MRPFMEGDARPMFEAAWESRTELRSWMTWCGEDFSLGHAERFVARCATAWQQAEHFSFAILDESSHYFLGSVGVNHICTKHWHGNIGYWVRNRASGHGIATGAVAQISRFALLQLNLARVEFLIPTGNTASQRVAQKVGARFEGVLRDRLMVSRTNHDAAVYSLLRKDLPEVQLDQF